MAKSKTADVTRHTLMSRDDSVESLLEKEFSVFVHQVPEIGAVLASLSEGNSSLLDLSVFASTSESWQQALEAVEKALAVQEATVELALWKLNCLVHLENYAEALAVFTSRNWPSEYMIHANYLAGLAYDGLEVSEQAKARFKAVFEKNENYRDVRQKLQKF